MVGNCGNDVGTGSGSGSFKEKYGSCLSRGQLTKPVLGVIWVRMNGGVIYGVCIKTALWMMHLLLVMQHETFNVSFLYSDTVVKVLCLQSNTVMIV